MTLLALFEMRAWISAEAYAELELKSNEIARMLHGLIRSFSS